MKILILCTGNSCRSQMAHGFLQSFDKNLTVCSAGTQASGKLNEKAVAVMKEAGIDISHHTSDPVEKYLSEEWDYVITVCGGANEACPAFLGKVKYRLHLGFDDPSHVTGTDDFIWSEFRRVRDEIRDGFWKFYQENLAPSDLATSDLAASEAIASELKRVVQEKYGQIARQSDVSGQSSCCGASSCCGELEISMIGDEYQNVKGHNPDADLGLGCGLPTQFAAINEGDCVLDLGSGAGNDCFVARAIVGETGQVTGLDFTEAMVEKATANNLKLGYSNVTFVQGDIDDMPFPDHCFDVVVSNCVLNLVPNKNKAFAQIMRVLKPKGHFCVSDVVLKGNLPEPVRKDAEMYVGCVSGAIQMKEYLDIIADNGFTDITIHKQREISIPAEVLKKYLSEPEIETFNHQETGIFSITISAHKSGIPNPELRIEN